MFDDDKYYITEYTYDHRNRVKQKKEPYKDAESKKITTYTYDGKGNVIGEVLMKQEQLVRKPMNMTEQATLYARLMKRIKQPVMYMMRTVTGSRK